MVNVTLKGNSVETISQLPEKGQQAPDFTLVAGDLSDISLSDFRGSKLVLNVFPSVDTGTCAASVRAFNEKAASLDGVTVLCVSKDLPFALTRFCGAEGLKNVQVASGFRSDFGDRYGLTFVSGPLKGLYSRCVLVLDEEGTVLYTEQVAEIADEPNYEDALAVLR